MHAPVALPTLIKAGSGVNREHINKRKRAWALPALLKALIKAL